MCSGRADARRVTASASFSLCPFPFTVEQEERDESKNL